MSRDAELVETHLPLVRKLAYALAKQLNGDFEDFYSSGLFGLMQAARRYDPQRHDSFGIYARDRIRGAILDYFRDNDRLTRDQRRERKAHPELAYRFHTVQAPFHTLASKTDTRANYLSTLLHVDAIRKLMKVLPPRKAIVVDMYYFQEKKLKEIGTELGFTESRACQILGEALRTMEVEAQRIGFTLKD